MTRTPALLKRFALLGAFGVVAVMGFSPFASPASANANVSRRAGGATQATTQADATGLARALGRNWWRSKDVVVTSSTDSRGYHLFVARGDEGFAWRPLATIQPDGYDAQDWIGYQCLTGSGRYVVVTVAPRHFANSPLLRDRGALAYVVDVRTQRVTPLAAGVALKYYSPGCGLGDAAVLTRSLGYDQAGTELLLVDASRHSIVRDVALPGQFTSAVPSPSVLPGIVAVQGNSLISINAENGRTRPLSRVQGEIFDTVPTRNGVAFLVASGKQAQLRQWTPSAVTTIGHGPLNTSQLVISSAGRAAALGIESPHHNAGAVRILARSSSADVVDAVSHEGSVIVGHRVGSRTDRGLDVVAVGSGISLSDASQLGTPAPATTATPRILLGRAVPRSAQTTAGAQVAAASANFSTPKCSVPRNDPTDQVPQPGPQQVERAVDLAVHNQLLDQRPSNFLNMGLAAYTPNGDFPSHALSGGGTVPAQVYLAILAQESNFLQASWHALPGIPGNPLIADYYGAAGGINQIDYSQADCGYGIGQITTGMNAADTSPYSNNGKRKIAVDYEENIAAGLQVLQDKWNQLKADGIVANDGSSQYVENWFMAAWAYNTGIQPDANNGNTTGCTPGPSCTDTAGNWGLGWTNNPMNADYPPNRAQYLDDTYADAATPGNWPYEERVMGWVAHPILDYKGNPSYSTPTWGSGQPYNAYNAGQHTTNVPPHTTFCTTSNNCSSSDPLKKYCLTSTGSLAYHCWWHLPVAWALNGTCQNVCATEALAFSAGSADPGVTDPHPPACNSTLPSNAIIVADLPEPVLNVAGCSTRNWTSQGSFALSYGTDASGAPIAQIDTHQLGVGLGGHIFFTHNRTASDTAHIVTGTWTPPTLATGVYHILAHLPATGATVNFAHYQVTTADGSVTTHVINQDVEADQWVGIGYDQLSSNAKVTLNNVTEDKTPGAHDLAFDALAFIPVNGTQKTFNLDLVSVFNHNQDLNTNTPWLVNTPFRTMTTLHDWAVQYSHGGPQWNQPSTTYTGPSSYTTCVGGLQLPTCIMPNTASALSQWYTQAANAGTSTTGHVNNMTEPQWLAFSNEITPPVSGETTASFANDLSYKVKSHMDVSMIVSNSTGLVIPGSADVQFTPQTADTHFPDFIKNFMTAMKTDYSIALPNLTYNEADANTYSDGETTYVDPLTNGYMPGRAYLPHYSEPQTTSDGQCAIVKSVSGGTIGWRTEEAQTAVSNSVSAWKSAIQTLVNNHKAPQTLADTAATIYSTFFNSNANTGSIFVHAPPIWQQINAKICQDGTISTSGAPAGLPPLTAISEQGYMPDVWLYFMGHAIDQNGQQSSAPVQNGDFLDFSESGLGGNDNNPYGTCDFKSRAMQSGNPWAIGFGSSLSDPADVRPKEVVYCSNPNVDRFGDPYPAG